MTISMNKIRVLVVDDSAFMRRIISDMLSSDSSIEVVGTARDGIRAIEKLKTTEVDVITMDVEMPRMNGLETLKVINDKYNIPIIMLSSFTKQGADITIDALEFGAFDFVQKPSARLDGSAADDMKDELISKVKLCCKDGDCKSDRKNEISTRKRQERPKMDDIKAVCIAASTGGPKALSKIIPMFPKNYRLPILIVQHMPGGFTKAFAERLNASSNIEVKEAEEGDSILPGMAYIAPGGYHMVVNKQGMISLNQEPPLHGVCPCADKLFLSAVENIKGKLVGVVLTGMGKDGSDGLEAIYKNNGVCIAEDESTCTIYGMPKSAVERGVVHKVLPLDHIVEEIINITGK